MTKKIQKTQESSISSISCLLVHVQFGSVISDVVPTNNLMLPFINYGFIIYILCFYHLKLCLAIFNLVSAQEFLKVFDLNFLCIYKYKFIVENKKTKQKKTFTRYLGT